MAKSVGDRLKNAEILSALADAMMQASEVKMTLAMTQEENIRLKREKDELQRGADLREKVQRRGNAYYLTETVAGYADCPYCCRCLDADKKLVGLEQAFLPPGARMLPGVIRIDTLLWRCPQCFRAK